MKLGKVRAEPARPGRDYERESEAALRLYRLLDDPKDSATIHYDEDTIPHGACSDPVHCDCCCPHCWQAKAQIVRDGIDALIVDATEER